MMRMERNIREMVRMLGVVFSSGSRGNVSRKMSEMLIFIIILCDSRVFANR